MLNNMYYQKASMCFKCCNAKRNKRPFPVSSLVGKSWTNESHSDQDSPGSWGPSGSLAHGWLSVPGGTSLASQAQSGGLSPRHGPIPRLPGGLLPFSSGPCSNATSSRKLGLACASLHQGLLYPACPGLFKAVPALMLENLVVIISLSPA